MEYKPHHQKFHTDTGSQYKFVKPKYTETISHREGQGVCEQDLGWLHPVIWPQGEDNTRYTVTLNCCGTAQPSG
mgnify:FL=1